MRAATRLRLIQLIDSTAGPADRPDLSYAAMVTPEGLAGIAQYADWIGAAPPSHSPETGSTVTPPSVVKVGMSDF